MLLQNVVGQPSAAGSNAIVNGRAGQQGDLIVSELHGRFYEANYRGNVYFGGHGSLIALSANTITLTASTTPILGVWNPASNTNNLVMLQASLNVVASNLTSGAGPGVFVWAISNGNGAISTGSNPFNARTLLASGSAARTFSGNVALTGLTSNLVVVAGSTLPSPSGLTYTTLASTALLPSYAGTENFDGALIVPPGGVLALLNTTSSTVFSAAGRLTWEEVPV
ncbi:MAG: hypothetical protein ACK52K_17005 [Alphaproteobacteria bacterium]|jgi:hypothetical protein